MKAILWRSVFATLILTVLAPSAYAGAYYGHSFWAGHNKQMFISQVYVFSLSGSDYPERHFSDRNSDFSRFLEVNSLEKEPHIYSRRDSVSYESESEALEEWEETISTWKRMGYSVNTVDYKWQAQ